MGTFDRSAYKASSLNSLKEEDERVDKALGNENKGGYAGFIKLDSGKNIIRIFPAHPNDKGNLFVEPRVTATVPVMVTEKLEDGSEKKVEKIKTVFNSKIHGGYSIDLIEEYIKIVLAEAEKKNLTKDEKAKYLKYIYGVFNRNDKSQNIFGLIYSQKWVMYAKKIDVNDEAKFERGRFEIGKAIKNRLNEISAVESENQAITLDPFSDPDTGIAVSVVYNKEAKNASDYYKTDLYMPRMGATQIKLFPLSDDDLDWLSNQESLAKNYQNNFYKKDLDIQIGGLEIIDRKSGYNVFSNESFMKLVEEMYEIVPEKPSEDKATETSHQEKEELEVKEKTVKVIAKDDVEENVKEEVKKEEPKTVSNEEEVSSSEQRLAELKARFLKK